MNFPPLKARRLKRLGLIAGAILLVALPRLTDLSGYLIVDEADRWAWAEAFYRALIAGNLRATLVGDGYPGIVPVWLETIWLLGESVRRSIIQGRWFGEEGVYVLFHVWSRTAHLAQQRLPIALFNTFLTLLVSWHTAKIYGKRVGLVALVFIALNPFYLADSRVNRAEAVITGLLTLSILFLIRYGQAGRRRWLILSGMMGGLSFLTKIQGVVVLPVIATILLFLRFTGTVQERDRGQVSLCSNIRFVVRDGVIWVLSAALIWTVFWPAMWVRPFEVLGLVFNYATRKTGSEGVNLFFMGQHFYDEDPGSLFYLVVAVMRMTPLTMLGLVLALWAAVRSLRTGSWFSQNSKLSAVVPLLVYIVLYTVTMTVGSHKQDRYLMPIFLVLDILGAMGWVYVLERLSKQWSWLRARAWTGAVVAGLVLVQVATVMPYHPYYFPYFNPLLGGGSVGAKVLRVGWGEGMDLVAKYLNTKPNAANLTAAARWYQYMFDFTGQVLPFDETGRWTQADYVVLYIQQTQRMLDPSPGVIRYFQSRQPEHVIKINGIEYAQIYPSPFTRPAQPGVSVIPGRAALLGFRWGAAQSSRMEDLRVIWENQGVSQSAGLVAALSDGDSEPAWYVCQTAPGFESAARVPGEVVESVCNLRSAADGLPAGAFDLRFALEDGKGSVDTFLFPQGWRSVVKEKDGSWRPAAWLESLDAIAQSQVPPTATPAGVYYQGQIRLLAYELSQTALQPGQSLQITLYWQAVAPVEDDYLIFVHLFGLDGTNIGQVDELPVVPTSRWLPGQVMTTTYDMTTESAVPAPAVATLDIGLYDAQRRALPATDQGGQPLPVTMKRLKFIPANWPDQTPPIVDDVVFGNSFLLKGHSVMPETGSLQGGETFALRLWWQALAPVDTDYTVFVHVMDAAGHVVAQGDGVPVEGRYPTSAWDVGERIIDTRQITLPPDLPAGEYRLIMGLYNPIDGKRLSPAESQADYILLGKLRVVG